MHLNIQRWRHWLQGPQTTQNIIQKTSVQAFPIWIVISLTLLGAVSKGYPVISVTSSAILTSKPIRLFSPVPTAVPPIAKRDILGSVALTRSIP